MAPQAHRVVFEPRLNRCPVLPLLCRLFRFCPYFDFFRHLCLNGDYSPCHCGFRQWQSDRVIKKDLAKSFGVVLQNRRKSAKMSQEKLSEKADVDVKMISRIETFIRNPSLNLADSLAN